MKIRLSILTPVMYEEVPEKFREHLEFVVCNPDELLEEHQELYDVFESSGYFRASKCFGISYKDIFDKAGLDINEYYQCNSYTLSKIVFKMMIRDINKNYTDTVKVVYPDVPLRDLMPNLFDQITVNEYVSKKENKFVIVIPSGIKTFDLYSLPVFPLASEYLEIQNEDAIEYLTADSEYIVRKEKLDEILSGFRRTQNLSPDFLEAVDNFKTGNSIARWEDVKGRNESRDLKTPWSDSLLELKEKIGDIIYTKGCPVKKKGEIIKLIRNVYR